MFAVSESTTVPPSRDPRRHLRTAVSMAIIFVLGFGMGWMILIHFWPNLFHPSGAELSQPFGETNPFE